MNYGRNYDNDEVEFEKEMKRKKNEWDKDNICMNMDK